QTARSRAKPEAARHRESACQTAGRSGSHRRRIHDPEPLALIFRRLTPSRPTVRLTLMRKGVPVSPGVAVARAYCVDEVLARREAAQLDVAAVTAEVQRFDDAVQASAAELDAIVERV